VTNEECKQHSVSKVYRLSSASGVYAAIASFLLFSMLQFRDGPFIRPHPAFWRVVLGVNLLYELALVFLLFQDIGTARGMMTLIDPNLGKSLPEKSYAEDCSLSVKTLWNALDIFCVAHTLGWFGKAMILRDYWFCWVCCLRSGHMLLMCHRFSALRSNLPNIACNTTFPILQRCAAHTMTANTCS